MSMFLSVPRALHFAYLMQAFEAAPESIMAKIIRANVIDCDVWGARKPSVVDFSGLTVLELHAECAGIRKAVERECGPDESAVIKARYELTEFEDVDGVRRFAFSKARIDALLYLSAKVRTLYFPDAAQDVIDILVGRAFAERWKTPITLRQIEEQFGVSKSNLGRMANRLDEYVMQLENRAFDTLMPYFTKSVHGVSIA